MPVSCKAAQQCRDSLVESMRQLLGKHELSPANRKTGERNQECPILTSLVEEREDK